MIKLSQIGKIYKINAEETFVALHNINLSIQKGQFIALSGASGCGKSTLMQIIGLLDRPSSGSIEIKDREASSLSDEELSTLRSEFIGFIFQQFNLIPKLSILENVLMPTLYARKNLSFNPQDRAQELLKRFGILDKAMSRPNKISGGQQQRVAIARALIMNPDLILADEPTGNLDSKTGLEIMSLLKELNEKDGKTILLVTHEADIASFAREKILMKDGTIISK